MRDHFTFTEADLQIREELSSFLPEYIFDAHAHIWRVSDLRLTGKSFFAAGSEEMSVDVWRTSVQQLLGRKVQGGLLFPSPVKTCDLHKANQYVVEQLENEELSRGLILVAPGYSEEQVHLFLQNSKIVGFKPYHCFSSKEVTSDSEIIDFIPESFWRIADQHGLLIMLHIVKDSAMADPVNQKQLFNLCSRYPNAKCVLAHSARSFHAPHANFVKSLRGLENVFFDMSAICEPEAIVPILYEFGPKKLLWGSDFPISDIRGKAVSVGDGFFWMQKETLDWDRASGPTEPTLVGLESLRALKLASDMIGLDKSDIQNIFYHNAIRLTGQLTPGGNQTQDLYRKAKTIIPGGTQLVSKRPELQAPNQWPAYFSEARGCEVWDLDGKHYYDMSTNGIGSCLLGYRNDEVTRAVKRRLHLGSMSTLNPPEEVELAERLLDLHPWSSQARFTRAGGEACSVAVRIARATTERSIIAVCGYHGWNDWYLAANLGEDDALSGHLLPGLEPAGVPRELRGTTVTFPANDRQAFEDVINQYGGQLAAVIMEPCRYEDPEPGFLQYVKERLHQCGALLIFDEITIGWRLHRGGAHLKLGVHPDIAVFAKALGNGHPIGAVIGTQEAMEGAHRSFISSTYWTESIGPAAALATLDKMAEVDVPGFVAAVGREVSSAWKVHGEQAGLPLKVSDGYPCLAKFEFSGEYANQLKTLYTVKMLQRGFLAGTVIYPTLAHTPDIVAYYKQAIGAVFGELADIIHQGDLHALKDIEVAQQGFRRLN
ncbi:aminotransferase class III-fold pyridoxal phosphate-dependent enzyme [Paenibacillus eucommiae]|uniref:Glutamate-1-semialdehyde 2,1-aminomutase n=1 Tax=Paenibacillus eucommiae TaxID=1355755 RepID=A0ABS4IY82_9BACL|nr:aminotransferase class III-fold pyridoxal phosphate-dependent enzyme [Paenibacillus eucommiae]MBP1992488.1 glutamate-1-semialdehyde 2,1-aminomutase [Paenibacillus eucommiae]